MFRCIITIIVTICSEGRYAEQSYVAVYSATIQRAVVSSVQPAKTVKSVVASNGVRCHGNQPVRAAAKCHRRYRNNDDHDKELPLESYTRSPVCA